MDQVIQQLSETLIAAAHTRTLLRIRGGDTKDFYGNATPGETLNAGAYRGIINYDPTELVITARAGTPLAEVEATLRERGQMLAFEPPHFGDSATLGGCLAAGLSGPRRPYAGAVRDQVLGVRMLDGKGSDLRFGGQVMKNVAGYDVSRLMTGSMGTLGVILEVSLKTLPLPSASYTLRREQSQTEAIALMNQWAGKPLPISATCHAGNTLYVRLSGAVAAVHAARAALGGEEVANADTFWRDVREQQLDFFQVAGSLWRLSIKSTTPPLILPGKQLIEWNGALRWLKSGAPAQIIREAAARAGGHATLFRATNKSAGAFHPLPPALMALHKRLKQSFDPAGILNRGRLYSDI